MGRTPQESVGGVLISLSRLRARKQLKSVTHGQCDARPAVTFPAAGHHRPLTGTKLYCLATEARVCQQLAQGRYLKVDRPGAEPATFCVASQRPNHYTTVRAKSI